MKITDFKYSKNSDGYIIHGYKGKAVDIEIPEGVTEIDYGAFSWCKIESVIFPKSLKRIRTEAFSYCESLMEIIFPESCALEEIQNHAFLCCESLKAAILPHGLKKIGEFAFASCDSLIKAFIPDTVTVIEENAFEYRNKKFRIQVDMPSIPSGFHPDWNMRADFDLTPVKSKAQAVAKPSGAKATVSTATKQPTSHRTHPQKPSTQSAAQVNTPAVIEASDPYGGKFEVEDTRYGKRLVRCLDMSIEELVIPPEIGIIGERAFFNHPKLKSVKGHPRLTVIEDDAFGNCLNLKEIEFPSGLTAIMSRAFASCRALSVIRLPDALNALWGGAFDTCLSIKQIALPEAIAELPNACFKHCEGLMHIALDGITTLCTEALYACHALAELTIPKKLRFIGKSAVYSRSLRRIVFEGRTSEDFAKIQKGENWLMRGDFDIELVFTDRTVVINKGV